MNEADLYALFDSPPDRILEFAQRVAFRRGLGAGASVLDMGCGPGRMLEPLAALGWRVTGREPHPAYAEHARRVVAGRSDVRVERGGWNDLDAVASHDAVLAVNGPFAYLLDPASRADALARTRRALRPGGLLLLDVPNFPWILDHYVAPHEVAATLPDGRVVRRLPSHDIDRAGSVFAHRDDFEIDGKVVATTLHRFSILSAPTLLDQVASAGFGDVATWSSYESESPSPVTGPRILLTANTHRATAV